MASHKASATSSGDCRLALIGSHLSHSYSKAYFEAKFKALGMSFSSYSLLEMSSLAHLHDTIIDKRLDGFNVTMPFKEGVMPLLDDIEQAAIDIGAVNTVKVTRSGGAIHLHGHNTDAPALLQTLAPLLDNSHTKALILGTGGAAKAASWALRQLHISHLFVSRNPKGRPSTISHHEAYGLAPSHRLIINATPVGMYPLVNETPWPHPELLTPSHVCYDLIYNPSPTLFLRQAAERGAITCGGLAMLHKQADLAFDIFVN